MKGFFSPGLLNLAFILRWFQQDYIRKLVKHLLPEVFEVRNILTSQRNSLWTQKCKMFQWKVNSIKIEHLFCTSSQKKYLLPKKPQATLTLSMTHFSRMRKRTFPTMRFRSTWKGSSTCDTNIPTVARVMKWQAIFWEHPTPAYPYQLSKHWNEESRREREA